MKQPSVQAGSVLIEALTALTIFSFGILGLIGLMGAAINTNADTAYRVEANNFANKMFSTIQGATDRTSLVNYQTSLASFNHLPTGGDVGADSCNFSGTASANAQVTAWLNALQTAGTRLPQARAQIRIGDGVPANILLNTGPNPVRIVICWQQPGYTVMRRHILMGMVT